MIQIPEKPETDKCPEENKCRYRPTPGVYTHVELHDQTAAIESLPGLPELKDGDKSAVAGESEAA